MSKLLREVQRSCVTRARFVFNGEKRTLHSCRLAYTLYHAASARLAWLNSFSFPFRAVVTLTWCIFLTFFFWQRFFLKKKRHRGSLFPSLLIISVYIRVQTAFVFSVFLTPPPFSLSFTLIEVLAEKSNSWIVKVCASNARLAVPSKEKKEKETLEYSRLLPITLLFTGLFFLKLKWLLRLPLQSD